MRPRARRATEAATARGPVIDFDPTLMLNFHPDALEAHEPLGVGIPLQIDRLIALRLHRLVLLRIGAAGRAERVVELISLVQRHDLGPVFLRPALQLSFETRGIAGAGIIGAAQAAPLLRE